MNPERIQKLIRSQPFRPFTVHLADGRQIAVRHPEFVELAPGGRKMTVHQPDDTQDTVELSMVTDLEVDAR